MQAQPLGLSAFAGAGAAEQYQIERARRHGTQL